jgi:hypothetical protein
LVHTPKEPQPGLISIRDTDDYPALYSAIIEGVDVFVIGDNGFSNVDIERPEIISPSDFLEKY